MRSGYYIEVELDPGQKRYLSFKKYGRGNAVKAKSAASFFRHFNEARLLGQVFYQEYPGPINWLVKRKGPKR